MADRIEALPARGITSAGRTFRAEAGEETERERTQAAREIQRRRDQQTAAAQDANRISREGGIRGERIDTFA